MKIICGTQKLKTALENSERILTRHLTLPILNNVLIQVINNGLRVASTNLEMAVSSWFPCKAIKPGEITIPAKIFYGIVSGLGADKVDLEVKKDNVLNIRTDNYTADIKGESAKDFPIIPQPKGGLEIKIKPGDVTKAISQVLGFVSNSETRPEITGVLLAKDKGENFLRVAGTDSFKLGEKKIAVGSDLKNIEFSVIVPARTAAEVVRIYSNENEELRIVLEKNQIYFESGKTEIVSRVIEGNYPDYRRLIPQEFKTQAVLAREDFIKTIKLVSLSSGRVNDVVLSFLPGKDARVKFFAADPDLGESSSFLPAGLQGEGLSVKFNWKYLIDGAGVIGADKIVLNFVDEAKPCLIKP
ncbi:MAG: DNA polymerase III subunit beta, partial [Patescibacteria group bacterium]